MHDSITTGHNPAYLLESNRASIVKLLMLHGDCSRSQLARMTNLTQAAITKIINSLMELGVVEESGLNQVSKGKRSIMLHLNTTRFLFIGIRLSDTSYSFSLFDLSGKQLQEETRVAFSSDRTPDSILSEIESRLQTLCASDPRILAVGFATTARNLTYFKQHDFITQTNSPEASYYVYRFRMNLDIPVFLAHDIKAAALAEWWFGNHESTYLLYLFADSSISSAFINRGKPLYGQEYAGELGHMSIDYNGRPCYCSPDSRGCVEQYCSSPAFLRNTKEQLPLHKESCLYPMTDFTAADIFAAAHEGDVFAISKVQEAGFYFGICLINAIRAYHPDTIVLKGSMTAGGQLMMDSIKNTLRTRLHPSYLEHLNVTYSPLTEDSVLLGAVAIAVDKFLENPTRLL